MLFYHAAKQLGGEILKLISAAPSPNLRNLARQLPTRSR
jgi:hypothetical protein